MSGRSAELQRLLASLNGNSVLSNEKSQNLGAHRNQTQIPGLEELAPPFQSSTGSLRGGAVKDSGRPPEQKLAPPQPQPQHDRSISTIPSIPLPDASTITTWPAALKHVTKHTANNDQITSRIKYLISDQHKHEEQWWTRRQEIVNRHAGRAGNQAKVADILKELGGLAAPMAKVDKAADRNELESFDKKVYKSLMQMAADFDGQLRKLGIPFYAIKHELVMKDGEDGCGNDGQRKLDKGELRELQKRMLQYLEDLLEEE